MLCFMTFKVVALADGPFVLSFFWLPLQTVIKTVKIIIDDANTYGGCSEDDEEIVDDEINAIMNLHQRKWNIIGISKRSHGWNDISNRLKEQRIFGYID